MCARRGTGALDPCCFYAFDFLQDHPFGFVVSVDIGFSNRVIFVTVAGFCRRLTGPAVLIEGFSRGIYNFPL